MADPFFSSSWFKVAKLRPRLRSHARVHRHRYRGTTWYVVDDGVGRRAHRFTWAAYMLIGRMDGQRTLDEIWHELVQELEDEAPTQDEVIGILGQLHSADLLRSDSSPDTAELLERHGKQRKQLLSQNLKSPMSLRIPMIDPDAFLNRTIGYVRPFLGLFGLILWFAIVIPAVVLAGMHWGELTENLSDRILAADNLLILAITYPVVKALHELGHGYLAKAYGREVREMGLMFLVFFPVPYVDASGAAALRSKYQRALVGAGGMIVETMVAGIAMYVWLLVEPGFTRAVAFNVMAIAGVSSLLVNGNPLLRFDGYYILADLIEIPNFGTRANKYLAHLIDRYIFRTHSTEPFAATRGERIWFLIYAPLSFVARMVMLFGIALFVAGKFFLIGVLLALWSLATGIVMPVWKMISHVVSSPQLRQNRRRALGWSGGAVAALALVLFVIPAPHHTNTEGVVWLPEEAYVRAGTDGIVTQLTGIPGHNVVPGVILATAERPALAAEVEAQEWSVREMQARLEAELTKDRVKAGMTKVELAEARDKLAIIMERQQQLTIASKASGLFSLAALPAEDLQGRHMKKGDLIGYVTPPRADTARALVPQGDIDLVRGSLRGVKLKLADRPEETFASAVIREVPAAQAELPSRALGTAGGGEVLVDPRDPQQQKTLERLFQFDLALPASLAEVPFGTRIFVRFEHDPEPIGFQIWRRVRQLMLSQFGA